MFIDTTSPLTVFYSILKILAGASFLGGLVALANVAFGLDYVLNLGGFYFELPTTYWKGGLLLAVGVVLYLVEKFVLEKMAHKN